jgi:hypothetical protein
MHPSLRRSSLPTCSAGNYFQLDVIDWGAMKSSPILLFTLLLALVAASQGIYAQCDSPELIKGAEKYNALVCKAEVASSSHDEKLAQSILLLAENESPVEKFPNVFLFDRIALSNARLGQFDLAALNLDYENISILWMMGIVRCKKIPNSDDEILFREGEPFHSENARYMANTLCGDIYDNNQNYLSAKASDYGRAAKMILRHMEIEKEIAALRESRPKPTAQK